MSFNWKCSIIGGLAAILLIIIVSLIPIHASGEDRCGPIEITYLFCFNKIMEQNERIEEKLDWANCATFHKVNGGYGWNWKSSVEINQRHLIEDCGEPPISLNHIDFDPPYENESRDRR